MIKKIIVCILLMHQAIDSKQYRYLFAHGIAANKRQARLFAKEYTYKSGRRFFNEHFIMDSPGVTFDFPDSVHAIEPSWIGSLKKIIAKIVRGNYDETSFGQDNEIATLHNVFTKKIPKDTNVIYGGISRGASIFFTWLAVHEITHIAGAVLESPFGMMAHVINLKRQQLGIAFFVSEEAGQALIEFLFRKYNRFGINPIDCIKNLDKNNPLFNTPILIIASTSDNLVPWESSFALYQELKKAGHTKVHFLLLEQGQHGFLLSGQDGKKYQQVTHAFYKHYGLPHDGLIAEQGFELWNSINKESAL